MDRNQNALKKFIDRLVFLSTRRRRVRALGIVLCASLALCVMIRLIQPAITATAQPVCGLEEHVHTDACYGQYLTCGLEADEEHVHSDSCYATVLDCGKQPHVHEASCYPEELAEPTLLPEETDVPATEAPGETVTPTGETPVETDVPATEQPGETVALTGEMPVETDVPATEQPGETVAPTGETPVETDVPATEQPGDALALSALQGPERLAEGEEGEWTFTAQNASELSYSLCTLDGVPAASGILDPQATSFRCAVPDSGLYVMRLTAASGQQTATLDRALIVHGGELSAEATTQSLSCFGGDEVVFALRLEGGVAPLKRHVTVCQGDVLLLDEPDFTGDALRIQTLASEQVTSLTVRVEVTDACGDTASAEAALPCAVRKTEARWEWEASLAPVQPEGVWPDDQLAVARTQLGYRESDINFVLNEEGERKGYTRYGDWYGSDHGDWCAMFLSFCLHYADIPEESFPREANCEKWIRALSAISLYAPEAACEPAPGNLVFFDVEGSGRAGHVGVVESVDASGAIVTIEGNSYNEVRRNRYEADDRTILGYGLLNTAYEAWLAEQPGEATAEPDGEVTPEPDGEATPEPDGEVTPEPDGEATAQPDGEATPEPDGEVTAQPDGEATAQPDGEATAQPDGEATPEPDGEATAQPDGEATAEPDSEATAEPDGEATPEPDGEAARLRAQIEQLALPEEGADAETLQAYEDALCELADRTLSAHEAGTLDEGDALSLLDELALRQAGGPSASYENQRQAIASLAQPGETAPAEEKIEYDALLAATREQLADAYQAGSLSKVEYRALLFRLQNIPPCPVECAYTALEGAVRVTHWESEEIGRSALSATQFAPDSEEYARYRQEIDLQMAREGSGSVGYAALYDISFDAGTEGAEVTIRLEGELAQDEAPLAAHRGEDGWQWLECERLTDAEGAVWLRFHADSFSPFAVLTRSADAPQALSLLDLCASQGGTLLPSLADPSGLSVETDEDGLCTVETRISYALRLDITCPEGLVPGVYAYPIPQGASLGATEGTIGSEEETLGQWSVDAESCCIRLVLAPASEEVTAFRVQLPLTFDEGCTQVEVIGTTSLLCCVAPDGPVAEVCVGTAWMALRDSGYFTYWSDKLRETEQYEAQASSFAAFRSARIASAPSQEQVVSPGGASGNGDGVAVSKTIAGTDLENVFDITLTVQSPTEVSEFYEEPDMAVVIVMDISNTMKSDFGEVTRYAAAMTAAERFIDQFAASNSMGVSKIGYVAFNTHAHEIFDLQPCANGAQATALKNQMRTQTGLIINANGYGGSPERFTNIEAGLKMGRDLLAKSSNAHKYIIFLSDGFPTTYVESGYKGYTPVSVGGTKGQDGVFANQRNGYYCKYGTNYSDKAAIRAREMAQSIRGSGVQIYSIGVDIGGQSLADYLRQEGTVTDRFSTVDCSTNDFEIGSAGTISDFKNWLQYGIGSGYYYDSTDTSGLTAAYGDIFQRIKQETEAGARPIWVTKDPLPLVNGTSQHVEFIGFYAQSGQLAGSLAGENRAGGENTASFGAQDSTISWDLKQSGYTTTSDGSKTIYNYSLTYRVRLKNEGGSFAEGSVYPTNDTTTLTYQVFETVNGETKVSETRKINYPIPSVKGYLAEWTFRKTDSLGQPLPGAQFTLAHDTTNCTACRGDGTAVSIQPFAATSDANGLVRFTAVPSGHRYVMTETVVPDGYVENGNTYSVEVAYDALQITVTHLDGTTETWSAQDPIHDIANRGIPRLPETGGTGPLPYAIGGIALMAVSLLFGRARKHRRERRASA